MRWLALALTVTAGCGFDSSALLSGTSGDGGMVVPVVDAGEPDALDNASCPEGYSYFGGHGYRFVEDGMTFDEAAFFCQSEGGHLAVLDSPGEATFVRGLTAERPWVGLHDRVVEGQFEWVVPGSAEPDWSSGEPNDSGRGEDCAILWEGEQLNDGTCDDQRSFICECDGREPAQPPACAVNGFYDQASNGRLYFYASGNLSWVDAQGLCVAAGANLASISDQAENDVIDTVTGDGFAWIGLYQPIGGSSYRWLDGDSGYRNFEEPFGSDGGCGEMTPDGDWHSHACDAPLVAGTVCECDPFTPPVPGVP